MAGSCTAPFRGQTLTFQRCETVNDKVSVYWTVNNRTLETLLIGNMPDGWVALGWGYKVMDPSNSVVAYKNASGVAQVDDYFAGSRTSPGVQPAGFQNLTFKDAHATANTISARFVRTLATPGNNVPPIKPAGGNPFIWAYGPKPPSTTSLSKHTAKGIAVVDFGVRGVRATQIDPYGPFFQAHGLMMGIAWVFLIPVAVLLMRFFKKLNPITFQIHRALNGLAVLLGAVAYIMGVARGSHTQMAHLAIGTIAAILAIVQVPSGLLRPSTGRRTRKVWFLFHAYPGRIALGLGILNSYFGMYIYGVKWYWFFITSILVVAFCAAVVLLSLSPTKFPIVDEERRDLNGTADGDIDGNNAG